MAEKDVAFLEIHDIDAGLARLPRLLEMPGGLMPGDLLFSHWLDPARGDPCCEQLRARVAGVGAAETQR